MKKLMIALVAVVIGITVNAASYYWSAESGRLFNGTGLAGTENYVTSTTAYLMFASVISQTDLVSGFNTAGSVSAYTATVADKAVDTGTVGTDARVAQTGFIYETTDNQTAYFVVFANDMMYVSETAAAGYMVVGDSGISFETLSNSSKLSFKAADGYSSAGWYATGSVPEPTSGLLILLGVAGLALKRKRA